jgi:hypothetical protein
VLVGEVGTSVVDEVIWPADKYAILSILVIEFAPRWHTSKPKCIAGERRTPQVDEPRAKMSIQRAWLDTLKAALRQRM